MPGASRPKLLIIEDNPDLAAQLRCVASSLGFACTDAADQSALTASLAEPHPDLVVLDLQLPDTDGIEVLRDLRARRYSGPIVLVSGHAPRTLRAAEAVAREQGLQVRGTLHKPFSMGRFRELLEEIPALQYGFPFPADNRVDESRLRRAIDAGQLAPWLQPQFDLVDGSLHGFEMLARWQHGDGSLTSPVDFIPVAERGGLIDGLTFSLLNELMGHLPSVACRNRDWRLSVNISPDSLLELDLPERLSACSEAAGFDRRRVTLEITESRLLHNLGASLDVLTRLSLRGFTISIDDFGTGYSTLGQLARPALQRGEDRSRFRPCAVHRQQCRGDRPQDHRDGSGTGDAGAGGGGRGHPRVPLSALARLPSGPGQPHRQRGARSRSLLAPARLQRRAPALQRLSGGRGDHRHPCAPAPRPAPRCRRPVQTAPHAARARQVPLPTRRSTRVAAAPGTVPALRLPRRARDRPVPGLPARSARAGRVLPGLRPAAAERRGDRCGACLRHPRRFASARTRSAYADPADQLVQALKFARRPAAARVMATLMAEHPPVSPGSDSVLVPVPLHWRRRWQRGFDQAVLLSRHLGHLTGIPVAERLLQRHRATAAQSGLDRRQRARNLARAFRWRGRSAPRQLILVDDVMTSGATLEAATAVCLAAGAERVDVWVFARTPPGRHDPGPDRRPRRAGRGFRG
ncbi:MAG: EAL domain-containing protein [Gammaproteobacteria bacterium]|nr:EAL domain-containing protein [Gammaproteobacteria bacterium]